MLAAPPVVAPSAASGSSTAPAGAQAPPPATVTGLGTANLVPLWTGTTTVGNSVLFQSGTGSTAKIGINTTTPASSLDVQGGATVRGLLNLPATGPATATVGKPSHSQDLVASAFSTSSTAAVNQTFQWKAEPVNNNTATPSATLNLLSGKVRRPRRRPDRKAR